MEKIIPVILCGGSGTRLWPKSRKTTPKQFQKILGEQSMFQETLDRVKDLEEPIIITNQDHRFEVAAQLSVMDMNAQILVEPVGRNTAPAIAAAAQLIARQSDNAIMVVLPSDHLIGNKAAFQRALGMAIKSARMERLVTFGVKPDRPETGYGYIRLGSESALSAPVMEFVEKPDLKTAEQYLAKGNYLWNSGMFIFKTSILLQEMSNYSPDLLDCVSEALNQGEDTQDFTYLNADAFARCEDISIDYALMEKTQRACCVTLDAHWNDLGGWASVWEESTKDLCENAFSGDVVATETKRCFVESSGRLVATVGVEDLVVVDTEDTVLIAHRDKAHLVKDIVHQLESAERTEHLTPAVVKRPWGTYEAINQGDRHQVKHIMVQPGESLSKQMHHHRAEHWVVVSGVAVVEIDGEESLLSENQSCFIPTGAVHRLTNPGKVELHLIEVQSGSYLGEDDIVRFEDIYGRVA